jgi:hypothetical protein
MLSSFHPRKIFTFKLNWCWILDMSQSHAATEIHALFLGICWNRISAKDQIGLPGITLAHHQHGLQHLPVGGQQDQDILKCSKILMGGAVTLIREGADTLTRELLT